MTSHLRSSLATGLALGLALVSFTACGSKSSSPATTTAASGSSGAVSAAAQQYLDIVGPANDAIRAQVTKIQALPATATPADLKAITDPWADAIDRTCDALGKASWPDNVKADMAKLIGAWRIASTAVRKGPTLDPSQLQAWAGTVSDTSVAASQYATKVRADLGLPPTEASTASN